MSGTPDLRDFRYSHWCDSERTPGATMQMQTVRSYPDSKFVSGRVIVDPRCTRCGKMYDRMFSEEEL